MEEETEKISTPSLERTRSRQGGDEADVMVVVPAIGVSEFFEVERLNPAAVIESSEAD